MSVGRPRSFDEGEVVEAAMHHFWRHGYANSGMSDLLTAMGISRQSLYDTFGNKRSLFIRVLAHYRDTQLSAALALLEEADSPLEGVREVLRIFQGFGANTECPGCLVANSIIEFGPETDPEISALLRDALQTLQQALAAALVRAQEAGELPASKSPHHVSRALTNSIVGMAVGGRLQLEQTSLEDVYAGTLALFD